ncbi:MAG: SLA1 homology domain 1, SHD1-domain-containing protein [Benniella sp.]|nr:MAG: SLA1 homology domain 1, SHD1-domain-containing protein [Benniella sp.]
MPFLKALVVLFDYEAKTEEELTIKENDVLYILEDDDPGWWKAQLKTANPNDLQVGLVPSNYVEPLPSIGAVLGLYSYQAATEEELTFEEGDTLTLYEQDNPDWFLVGNGFQVGFVPRNYVEEIDKKKKMKGSLDIYNKTIVFGSEEDKSTVRQWIRHEESHVYLDLGGTKQEASFIATHFLPVTAPTPAPAPAPPPLPAPVANKPKNTRMWTDRSGNYKVEAEYLGFHDGKISLHKMNGVKIAVPVREMSQIDIFYVEQATDMKISESDSDLFRFFVKAGIPTEDALRYSSAFRQEKIDSTVLPYLTREVLKDLKVKEGDIVRIQIATGSIQPRSPDS